MNMIPVFHPAAQVSPLIEDMVRELMLRERGIRARRLVRERQLASAPARPKNQPVPKKVLPSKPKRDTSLTIRGVKYRSCGDAARRLGLSRSTVIHAKKAGQEYLDRCGLGENPGNKTSITIHGVTYASLNDAAAAYGICLAALYRRRQRGTLEELPRIGGQS